MASDTDLSVYEAAGLVDKLRHVTLVQRNIVRDLLLDLPPADIDVLRGLVAMTERRAKDTGAYEAV